jgi:iron complex outermembrane receptor protein
MKYLYLYLFSRNILHSALFLFVFVLLNTALPAQDNSVIDSDKTAEGEDFFTSGEMWADEIVVTATKGEKTVRNAPGAVTVITKEEIDARPTAQMHTLLNAIPGFYSQQGDNFSVFGSTTVRGISGDRMVFMLDGMPVKDPRAGGFFAEGISPSSLERVESVRGPMSALYGSGLAGAVNFITKMPEKREFTAKADYGNPFVEGTGNANAWTAYFSYGDKLFDCLSILLSYNRRQTDGFPNQLVIGSSTGSPPPPLYGNYHQHRCCTIYFRRLWRQENV